MGSAIPAIIAVAGTILGASLAYVFQNRASERAEASSLRRELRAERMGVYSSYMTALTEWRRGQTDWNNRRFEDPDGEATFAAAVESYRLKGIARGVLAQIRLVTSDPAIVTAAISAFELTRPIHYAQDSTDQRSRTNMNEQAIEAFAVLAASEVQSAPLITRGRRTTAIDRLKTDA